jgi:hypothetical protein
MSNVRWRPSAPTPESLYLCVTLPNHLFSSHEQRPGTYIRYCTFPNEDITNSTYRNIHIYPPRGRALYNSSILHRGVSVNNILVDTPLQQGLHATPQQNKQAAVPRLKEPGFNLLVYQVSWRVSRSSLDRDKNFSVDLKVSRK